MDPLTHGIIGLGVAALTGETELMSPITIGAVVGAMSPDIDGIIKYWGNYKYLKHHRGETHSIIALMGISLIISGGLSFMFSGYQFFNIFLATFIGALSHTFFDSLNSYGVRPFMPFTKKKYLSSLLMLYDPFLTVLSIGLFLMKMDRIEKLLIAISGLSLYLTFRYLIKKDVSLKIAKEYNLSKDNRLYVIPDLTNFFKWVYIVETDSDNIVGKINFINDKIVETKRLKKQSHKIIEKMYSTELGEYFKEFTSEVNHVNIVEENGCLEIEVIDLRYFIKNDFMHHATFVFDKEENLMKSVFRPYKYEKEILVELNE